MMITISNGRLTGRVESSLWDTIQRFQTKQLNQRAVLAGKTPCVMEFVLHKDKDDYMRCVAFAPVTNEPRSTLFNWRAV